MTSAHRLTCFTERRAPVPAFARRGWPDRVPGGRGQRAAPRGAALIVGVILLVVLSVLVISSMRGAVQQETMSSNLETRVEARQLAEAALRQAEQIIRDRDVDAQVCVGDLGTKVDDAAGGAARLQGALCDATLPAVGADTPRGQARFVIERMPPAQNAPEDNLASDEERTLRAVYRVTAEGVVGNGVVMVQSFFAL